MDKQKRPDPILPRALISGLLVLVLVGHARAQDLPRVEITGSSIKRVQVEGPVPVEVYRRQDIERTGATTINELMRSIASLDFIDTGELMSNIATGSGTATIVMRGLPETNVLVLLNGRRLPINALSDVTAGGGAAVDVNLIPLSAIERIEILKDGGSAIYGADAVSGVVNFITRKDYTGADLRAGYGFAQQAGGEEKSAGLTFGFGELETAGYNVFVGLDVFKRKPIFRKDRDITRSADYRRVGGPDARSTFSPSGNLLDADGNLTGATVRSCPADSLNAGICRYDYNATDILTAYNGADRISGLVIGTLKLPQAMRLSGELMLAQTKDHFESLPVADIFTTPANEKYRGRFLQGGPRLTDRQSDLYQVSAGLEGELADIDWKLDVGQGRIKVVNRDQNFFDRTRFDAATANGTLDPTVTTNPQSIVDGIRVSPRRVGNSRVAFADFKMSGEFGSLAGGPVGYAFGTSLRRERLVDQPDPLNVAGLVVGNVQQPAANASRGVYAVFGEFALPLAKSLESQLALRYDHYADYSRASPRLAARWVADPAFSVRGSYSRSFNAPGLKQLYGGRQEGASTFESAELCQASGQPDDCAIVGFQIYSGNPALKPERGATLNFGAVIEPVPGFSASLDWWRINVNDAIDTPTVEQAVAQGLFGRDAQGRTTVQTPLQNFARISNQGVDVDVRWRLPKSDLGDFSVRNSTTYYMHQRKLFDSATGWQEFNATYSKPRWRNTLTISLDSGPWQANLAIRNTAGFYDTDEPVEDASTQRRVEGFSEMDLTGSYTGLKSVKIDFGIKNLLNESPPFSVQNVVSGAYSQMGFAELYSARGRFYYASVSYAF